MRVRKSILAILSLGLLSACGGEDPSTTEYSEERTVDDENAPVENQDQIYSYEVILKDGRTAQCVVSYWGQAPSMQCDFENTEITE